jgi:hypothetical protein
VATFHNTERAVAAGSDGQNFLVIGLRGDDPAVYAHRVSASGELLDRTNIPIRLPHGASLTRVLGVFWTGNAYTVLIQTQLSPGGSADGLTTFVARVAADGSLVAARPIASGRTFDSAASNGATVVLAGPKLAVLDLDGNVVEPSIDLPLEAASSNASFRIASNGAGFMVSWTTFSAAGTVVSVAPLDANGHPAGASRTMAGQGATTIASDGNDYVVLYQDANGNASSRHVTSTGDLLQQNILPRLQEPVGALSIVWNGSLYVVSANSGPSSVPNAMRLNRTGAALDTNVIVEASSTAQHLLWKNLATNGHHVLATWRDGSQTPHWYGGLLDGNLNVSVKFPIGITATPQVSPSVATNGTNLFAVWEENGAIYGMRMSLTGQRLDAQPRRFSLSDSFAPRVVWDGQSYFVVWHDSSANIISLVGTKRLVSAFVSPDGVGANGPQIFGFSELCLDDFDMAGDGDGIFVVASACHNSLLATRVHRGGTVDPPVIISPASMKFNGAPRVAWNGAEYLVAWEELFPILGLPESPQLYQSNIRAERVSASLNVLDPEPLAVAVTDTRDTIQPLVATDGRDFLVAWTREAQPGAVLFGRSVGANGTLGAETSALGPGRGSSLVWDGRRFDLAFSTLAGDTFLRRIGADFLAIENGPDDSYGAALAPLPNGTIIAAYDRVASEPEYGLVPRVFVKTAGGGTRARAVR